MDSNRLSRRIINEIFGTEFVKSYKGKLGDDVHGGSTSGSSPKNKQQHSISDNGPMKNVSLSQKSQKVPAQHNIHNGVKPSKNARVTNHHDILTEPKEDDVLTNAFDNLSSYMTQNLNNVSESNQTTAASSSSSSANEMEGRLGPKIVKYDVAAYIGSFIITNDRLGVSSQCNFGSVRANVCVWKGKWMYEVQLGSKGVMQLGWCGNSATSKFSQEKGVGDTQDSFAYDGNRLRKWNQSTAPYGETWQSGDIIGCCIDLDKGEIEFYRNGKSLGVAFTNVNRGAGVAYFPAASLAFNENIIANFGATPMQYAVPGYSPMQLQRSVENAKTDLLLHWLERSLRMFPNDTFIPEPGTRISSDDYNTLLVISNRIFEFLGPNMHSSFVVERAFLPFFAKTLDLPEKVGQKDDITNLPVNPKRAYLLLDAMWTFLEESEMKSYLERLCVVLLSYFRSNSLSLSYPFQHYSLRCLIALCGHRRTRRHFLHHLFFDKTTISILHFIHIRPVDEEVLKELMPEGWYAEKGTDTQAYHDFNSAIKTMSQHIVVLEELQIQLLRVLLTNDDGTDKRPSSRSIFLKKMRLYIRDTIRPGSVLQQSVNKAMCTFFRFLKIISIAYADEVEHNNENKLPELPQEMFYDTTINYYDIERVGGLSTYLYKAHHIEVSRALNIPDYVNQQQQQRSQGVENGDDTPMPGFLSIIHQGHGPMSSVSAPLIRVTLPEMQRAPGQLMASSISSATATTGTTAVATHRPPANVHHQTPVIPITVPAVVRQTAEAGTETQTPSEGVSTGSVGGLLAGTGRRLLGRSVSATSSGEELSSAPLHPIGAALIAGSPGGRNMLIPTMIGFMGFGGFEHRSHVLPHNPAAALLGRDSGSIDVQTSLRELLDDTIIVFSCGVLKHVDKVVLLHKLITEYTKALAKANANLNSNQFTEEEKVEIRTSIDVFSKKLEEQSRHLAWVKAAVFTPERQKLAFTLLKLILRTLKTASTKGVLFSFVPELYISAMVNLTWLLLTQMNSLVPYTDLPGIDDVLVDVAEFVSTHFADSRIVIAETKDTLTQALSMFICNRTMLSALEGMESESQATMVKAILRPYQNRAWAQSNWMLVRMWQGHGFGFQYANSTKARRSFRAKPIQDEFGISPNLPPTPSSILQGHVSNLLISNQKMAVTYIHSVLNQLNWAFSEFVGLLQEIQNAATRPERVFIESRQLKICCTCFELTQALLRVMEMVFTIAAPVLNDFSREGSESLLGRLCMLLSQILNRIGSNSGSFAQVIELDIAGLENVNHYPLLSAVAGILLAALRGELGHNLLSEVPVTKTLLSEPSFQVKSLDYLFGRSQQPIAEGIPSFSLADYIPDDVSEQDVNLIERIIEHLNTWNQKLQSDNESINDDDICTICYAYPKTCTFKPCNHRSCKTCIVHHLMNRGECFFCKAIIQQVFDDDNVKIHDIVVDSDTPSETTLAALEPEDDIL